MLSKLFPDSRHGLFAIDWTVVAKLRHDLIYCVSKVFWLIAAPTRALILINGIASFWAVLHGSTLAAWLAAAAASGLLIAAFTPIGVALGVPLEKRFAFALPDSQAAIDGIIVLAGHGARTNALALLRQRFPKASFIFSGFKFSASDSENLVARLGVDPARVYMENRPRTTAEDALYCAALLNPNLSQRWLLVTSTLHMPRAVGCFRAAGFEVTPYPLNFRTKPYRPIAQFAPGAALNQLDATAKEWVGLVAYRLMGKTDRLFPGP
jgi:uncharacterized SAM-binding protein YcdF (DUF218 family)